MPAATTVLTSASSPSLVRPGLKTRKKIACLAPFISWKTSARSLGTVRVAGVPTMDVFGENQIPPALVVPLSVKLTTLALAERRAAPWFEVSPADWGRGVG